VPTDLSKSPDRIAGMFDAIAGRYDLLNRLLSAGVDRRWRARAIEALALRGGERVLDLCTGTGDLALAAVHATPAAARVIGVDFSGAMLRIAQQKVREDRARGVALVRGDATRIPIATAAVDAITVGFGIRNVQRVEDACDEMNRVLAPGGRFAILEFGMPTIPGLRTAYAWYFNHLLPRIGRAISRDASAYSYLPASVGAFARPQDFVSTLKRHGFVDVSAAQLTFGIVYLYTGRTRSEDRGQERSRLLYW
jgi:demethylmenaquinone methyltransferase/2-methoxy-6-polyprenyl-1,4-benzoquinol methylase